MLLAMIAMQVSAQETRMQTLTQSGNLFGTFNYLINDEYLIQPYSSRIFDYKTHASLEMPKIGNALLGNFNYASAFYVPKNKNFAIGTYIGRSASFGGIIPGVITPFNVVVAYKISDKLSAAVNIDFERQTEKDTTSTDPGSKKLGAIGFTPSLTYRIDDQTGIDVSIPILTGSAYQKTGNTVDVEGKGSLFSLNGRYYSKNLIIPIMVGSEKQEYEITASKSKNTTAVMRYFAGVGQNRSILKNSLLMYGINITGSSTTETQSVNDDKKEYKSSKFRTTAFVGSEINIWKERLKARGSIGYFLLETSTDATKNTNFANQGALSLGLGYDTERFRIDASFSTDMLYAGVYMINGTASAFIASITGIVRF